MPVASTSQNRLEATVMRSDCSGAIVTGLHQAVRRERWTDVILYSKERIPIHVHSLVLSQSKLLSRLFSSLACCQGRCSNQTTFSLILPDISHHDLQKMLDFLYTGQLECTHQERAQLLVFLGIVQTS